MNTPAHKIIPNAKNWNKPLKYYKEYESYVRDFNAAVDRARKENKPDVTVSEVKPEVEELTQDAFTATAEIKVESEKSDE